VLTDNLGNVNKAWTGASAEFAIILFQSSFLRTISLAASLCTG
jgi:hypothetical protein